MECCVAVLVQIGHARAFQNQVLDLCHVIAQRSLEQQAGALAFDCVLEGKDNVHDADLASVVHSQAANRVEHQRVCPVRRRRQQDLDHVEAGVDSKVQRGIAAARGSVDELGELRQVPDRLALDGNHSTVQRGEAVHADLVGLRSSCIDNRTEQVSEAKRRGNMQGSAPVNVKRRRARSGLDQRHGHVGVASDCCHRERRLLLEVEHIERHLAIDELRDNFEVVGVRGNMQRVVPVVVDKRPLGACAKHARDTVRVAFQRKRVQQLLALLRLSLSNGVGHYAHLGVVRDVSSVVALGVEAKGVDTLLEQHARNVSVEVGSGVQRRIAEASLEVNVQRICQVHCDLQLVGQYSRVQRGETVRVPGCGVRVAVLAQELAELKEPLGSGDVQRSVVLVVGVVDLRTRLGNQARSLHVSFG
mmetsp:Transcript_24815/g.57241  ORF Transcript_24815/g.57241 Transcript_24815/m.57241 type:complete len:417 (+) Transcript_24815:4294-5544(+)